MVFSTFDKVPTKFNLLTKTIRPYSMLKIEAFPLFQNVSDERHKKTIVKPSLFTKNLKI